MDTFGQYMFSLLFAPMKRLKQSANQFRIFFNVIGRQFDQCKQDIFTFREQSMVVSASLEMLPVHGQDRDMYRLKGETIENYRLRLAMKANVAETAGTNTGILNLARSFGYENVEIIPGEKPDKWAEATVRFIGGNIVLADRELRLAELDKIKPTRTLLHIEKEQQYPGPIYVAAAYVRGRQMTLTQR